MSGEQDMLQNAQIADNKAAISDLSNRVGNMETDTAVLGTKVEDLGEKVTTGFLDLKDVIKARAEQDKEERKQAHELELQHQKNTQAWWGKAFGIISVVATALAGGGGAAYYGMADRAEAVEVPAPAAPVQP